MKFTSPTALLMSGSIVLLATQANAGESVQWLNKNGYAYFSGMTGSAWDTFGPAVTQDNDKSSFTFTKHVFDGGAYYHIKVGFVVYKDYYGWQYRRYMWQTYGPGQPTTNYYLSPAYWWNQGDSLTGAMQRTSGNDWLLEWYQNGYRYYTNITHNAGGNSAWGADAGVDNWGGCNNSYSSNDIKSWRYKDSSGWWYTSASWNNRNSGNDPSWAGIIGNLQGGGTSTYRSTGCP